ncbi:GTP pyrophosphokinase [Aeromonas dhakensis]|uniref:GTP pyrophosphokinase n=2 Tax=Aeromonas dhakensis TaxID=196024 RepID=UPI0038CF63EC
MSNENFIDWYIANRPIYKRLANKVESFLIEFFDMNSIGYHMVTSRTKEIESAIEKSKSIKYKNPSVDIQDFAGIRIITYVEDEIPNILKVIEDNFQIDRENSSNKSSELGVDRVGYQSIHYIAKLKEDRLRLPEYNQYSDKCFEIQIRTILQHAWAEIEHDRNYKFSGILPTDLNRRFKILAGVLELADKEFNAISKCIDDISDSVNEGTKNGNLDIPISSTTLTQFLHSRFENLIEELGVPSHDKQGVLIKELNSFGIHTLKELNDIIPQDIESYYRAASSGSLHELGMIRSLMILNDYKKYYSTARISEHNNWCSSLTHRDSKFEREYFTKHGVDWDDIERTYGVSYHCDLE